MPAAASSSTDATSAQASQGVSVHQPFNPWASTAASRATPGATSAKVTKSSRSSTWMCRPSGSFKITTADSAHSASPASNRYSVRQSPESSSAGESTQASGVASCAIVSPTTRPAPSLALGNACSMYSTARVLVAALTKLLTPRTSKAIS